MSAEDTAPQAEDCLARFPAYLVSPGYVAAAFLLPEHMRPLQNPRSLDFMVDGNFCEERRRGRSQLAVRYWQLVHELPCRFAELMGADFDREAWHAALAAEDELPLVCDWDEMKQPFNLPFTRGGKVVGELLAVWTSPWSLANCYHDKDTLCLRYEASEENAAWELIRGIIRDYGIEYHPLSTDYGFGSRWWL